MLQFVMNVLQALTIVYSLAVIVYLALRFTISERWVSIGLFNTFAEWLFLPALILLPLALLMGAWLAAVLCLVPLGALCMMYGTQFLPRPRLTTRAPRLRVMTYNILGDVHPLHRALALIRAVNADFVAIQEMNKEYVPELAALADMYPYVAAHPQPLRFDGQAIYSKFPILEDHYWQHDWVPTPLGNQRVVLKTPMGNIVVYNVHPTHPGMNGKFFDPSIRAREIDALLTRIQRETLPLIVLGDFNMPDQSDDYNRITATLHDAWAARGAGFGWTFRAMLPLPFLRLDYVFHDAHWTALEAHVVPTPGGSDHHPVLAVLAFEGAND